VRTADVVVFDALLAWPVGEREPKGSRHGHAFGGADALCVAAGRAAEVAAVFPAELGDAVVADTADVYGPHTNELLIKEALHPYPEGLVVATKGGFVRGGFDYGTLDAVGNPNYLRQSAHLSARRSGVDAIDLYYLHSGTAKDAPFEDQVGVLAELRQAGLIRHLGLSNVTLERLRIAQSITPIAAVTALYNVTARVGADLLAAAEEDGIVFSPWHPVTTTDGPLAARAAEVLPPIAAAHGATVQQIALAWQLQGSPQSLPIPGTTSLAHLRENLAAQSILLTTEEMRAIDGIADEVAAS
jgi:aryl-alcohol dehydrogenase-like predicted oxidoreductase